MSSYVCEEREYVIGNPDVYEEYQAKFANRQPDDQSPMVFETALDGAKMSILQDTITDVDINGDGYNDVIKGRAYRIGVGKSEDPFRWITFTSVFFGGPYAPNTSVNPPDMIDASEQMFEPIPAIFEQYALKMVYSSPDELDHNVATGVYSVMTFAYNSVQYFDLYGFMNTDCYDEAQKTGADLGIGMREEFYFMLDALKRWSEKETDPLVKIRYKNIINELEEKKEPLEPLDVPGYDKLKKRWVSKEKILDSCACDDLYSKLLNACKGTSNQIGMANALRKQASYIQLQKEEGGLFDSSQTGFIAKANEYARRHGFSDYAEMRLSKLDGLSPDDFEKMALEELSFCKSILESVTAEARAKGEIVEDETFWDVLEKKRLDELEKLGVKEEPTFFVAEAMEIIEKFKSDLGFDQQGQAKPKVIFDIYQRKKKKEGDFHISLGYGSSSVIINSFGRGQKLTLEDLAASLVHELGHHIHFSVAAETSGGSWFGSAQFTANAVKESIAKAIGEIVYSNEWLDRYASKYQQFKDPRVRAIMAGSYQNWILYWNGISTARALWEVGLYQNRGFKADGSFGPVTSFEEMLDGWGYMGANYMGYHGTGIPTSQVSYYNLKMEYPGTRPLVSVSYASAPKLYHRIQNDLKKALASPNHDVLPKMFERLRQLFHRSSSLSTVKAAEEAY